MRTADQEEIFSASNTNGNRAKIQKATNGYSVFVWRDNGAVVLWQERHELTWSCAYMSANLWLNNSTMLFESLGVRVY